MSYARDGRTLATGGCDGMLRVWDAATFREIATLRADRFRVLYLAFAPDGRRLAVRGDDNTLRICDTVTYRQIIAIPTSDLPYPMAFAPDGQTLATSGRQTVRLWEAAPLSPERRIHREALGLVQFLLDRSSCASDLARRIRSDVTISDDVRTEALAMADPLWDDHAHARAEEQARALVEAVFSTDLLREEAEDAIRARPGLDPQVRAIALELAGIRKSTIRGEFVRWSSWAVAREPGRRPAEYQRALRLAEETVGERPDVYATVALGVAQYRNGQYAAALAALTGSAKWGSGGPDGYTVQAFIALCRYKLGQIELARFSLGELHTQFRANPPAGLSYLKADLAAILREAECVIELDPAFPADPFAR